MSDRTYGVLNETGCTADHLQVRYNDAPLGVGPMSPYPPPMLHVSEESLLERRAWEIFRDAMRSGSNEQMWAKVAFDSAEAFAAEAKVRREKVTR